MAHASSRKDANVANAAANEAEGKERRRAIATFFKEQRQTAGMSLEQVASALPGSCDADQLRAFEMGHEAMPLDLIFSLTNLYNIPPEDTLNLIHDVYGEQGRK